MKTFFKQLLLPGTVEDTVNSQKCNVDKLSRLIKDNIYCPINPKLQNATGFFRLELMGAYTLMPVYYNFNPNFSNFPDFETPLELMIF